MKHKAIILMTFLLVSCSMFGQSANLKFLTKRIINCGTITKDTIINKAFRFINNGANALKIEKIYKSCTCTKVVLNKKRLNPNEEGLITLTVDTKNKIGEQEVIIHIIANTKEIDHVIMVRYSSY